MRRLAIIPARGGSKRIAGKNIRNFCGSPIISYTLNAAKECGFFDAIHVSTDSSLIAEVVKALGFSIDFFRDGDLADDFTPLIEVLNFVVTKYVERGLAFDQVWCLLPCAPLLTAEHLHGAKKIFEASDKKRPLIPVLPFPAPHEWSLTFGDHCGLKVDNPQALMMRSQDLLPKYYDAGVFCIYTPEIISDSRVVGEKGFIGYILPKYSVIDIDDIEDWQVAEALYMYRHKHLIS